MSLITETKKLRELEQKAQDAPDWPSPVEEVVYTDALLQHDPAMLSVLECFREGDPIFLRSVLNILQAWNDMGILEDEIDCISRLQKAASLMEQES